MSVAYQRDNITHALRTHVWNRVHETRPFIARGTVDDGPGGCNDSLLRMPFYRLVVATMSTARVLEEQTRDATGGGGPVAPVPGVEPRGLALFQRTVAYPGDMSHDTIVQVWEKTFGVRFAATFVPLNDDAHDGLAMILFEWKSDDTYARTSLGRDDGLEKVAVGVIVRFTEATREVATALVSAGAQGEVFIAIPTEPDGVTPVPEPTGPTTEVLPRVWMIDGPAGSEGDTQTMERLVFPVTRCTYKRAQGFRDVARFTYVNTAFVPPILISAKDGYDEIREEARAKAKQEAYERRMKNSNTREWM